MNLVAGEIGALRIDRRKRPKIAVVLGGVVYVRGVVLGYRLQGPSNRVPGCVLHDSVEQDFRRVAPETDFTRILETGAGVNGAVQTHGTGRSLRDCLQIIGAIVELIGNRTGPVLFIAVPLRQRPELISSIVEPLTVGLFAGDVLSLVF